jgi:hypothetical protein
MHSDRRNHHARMMARFPHSDILGSNARLAAPRGLSQPPTSFIGFWRQGIHRVPFLTWQHSTQHQETTPRQQHAHKMLALTMQFSTHQPRPNSPGHTTQPHPPAHLQASSLQASSGSSRMVTPGTTHPNPLPTPHPKVRAWTGRDERTLPGSSTVCAATPPRRRRSHPPGRHDDEVMTSWVTVLAAAGTLTTE